MTTPVVGIRGGRPHHAWRLVALAVAFVLASGVLVARLVSVQVLHAEGYREYGESQRMGSIELVATRGPILDRNGVQLAMSSKATTIWADPALVTDVATTAAELSRALGTDPFALEDELSRDSRFSYIARQVSDEKAEAVRELDLDGIFFSPEPRRYNPSGEYFASAILGQAGIDGGGVSGIEKQYADLLTGEPGRLVFEAGARTHGRPTIVNGQYSLEPAVPGNALALTIDRGLQFEVEKLVGEAVDDTGSDFGIAMIMDTSTGELLAVANVAAREAGPARPSRENRAFTWLYELGSIAKTFTFAGLIEAGLVTPQATMSVEGRLQVYDAEFEDHPYHDEVTWTATEILTRSSNVGTIKFAETGGEELLHDTLVDFGVLESPGLGFPGETAGLLPPVDEWSGVSHATIAIGQGVAATPLRWLTAYNSIANDGIYVHPSLVSGSTDAGGDFTPIERPEGHRVVSVETAQSLTTMLEAVVTGEGGTGVHAQIPGYVIAGKTGTAEKIQPTGGYTDEDGRIHYVASFAGFVPADDPQVTILVVMDDPDGDVSEASRSAAPLFGELALRAIRHQEIPQVASEGNDGRVRSESALELAAAAEATSEGAG